MMMTNMVMSQESVFKVNTASRAVKEDPYNDFDLDNISKLDIVRALEMLDIRITKIKIPKTDKEHSFGIVIAEYSKEKLIRSDTTWRGEKNTYTYWEQGDTVQYKDFIEDLTLYTRMNKQDSVLTIRFQGVGMDFGKGIRYKPETKYSYYQIRKFSETAFGFGKTIPLVVVVSSWYDPRYNLNVLCGGSATFTLEDTDTQNFLHNSPNYYVISYILK